MLIFSHVRKRYQVWLLTTVACASFLKLDGFLHQRQHPQHSQISVLPSRRLPRPSFASSATASSTSSSSSTQLSAAKSVHKLWDRLGIEEDPEPYWYLINCVAGLEHDLLRQCRQVCRDMPDAVKFVVPTETKTRSHGAKRMVTEEKVKYLGYVFAKLRLCPEVYEAIQELDLCRSWMGTVNHKGYKKLPPIPLALNELEVENFGLEDFEFEEAEEEEATMLTTQEGGEPVDVIVDDEAGAGTDPDKSLVDEKAIQKFLGIKVDDMVKVTKKGTFYDEDAIVRRLKDGKILLRFYTYGSAFEEWMEPGDVRKLTDMEVLKGLSGPTQPVTQREFDEPGGGGGGRSSNGGYDNANNGRGGRTTTFRGDLLGDVKGARGLRNRREDRVKRGQTGYTKKDFFGRTEDERKREERNWDWFKENRRGKEGVVADDEWSYRPGSVGKGNDKDDLGNENSQWNRPSQRQQRRDQRNIKQPNNKSNEDWSAFVSPASAPARSRGEDDFFASLMTDLSKDLTTGDGDSRSPSQKAPGASSNNNQEAEEDSFFASLMAEISTEEESSRARSSKPSARKGSDSSSLYVEDFFASLDESSAKGTRHTTSGEKKDSFNEDDLFDSFDIIDDGKGRGEIDLFSSFDDEEVPKGQKIDEEDFFASLDELVGDAVEGRDKDAVGASAFDDDGDFFASLEKEVASQLGEVDKSKSNADVDTDKAYKMTPAKKTSVESTSRPTPAGPADLGKLTVPKLKEMLRERGLKVSGKKAELIERLSD